MLSYLTNRHYHQMSKPFPPHLRQHQPQVVFLRTHHQMPNDDTETIQLPSAKHSSSKNKRTCQTVNESISCCPICFSSDNVEVQFYGKGHVCVKCRSLLRDRHGNQARIFINQDGDIVCLGIKVAEDRQPGAPKVYYYTDYTALSINGRSAFATFAAPNQMVIILRIKQA